MFLRGLDRSKLPAVLALDTQAMLLDGLRRLDEMEMYRTRVPDSEVKPKRTGKQGAIEVEHQNLLALADGKRTVSELATSTALGEFETTKIIYKLLEAGYVEI